MFSFILKRLPALIFISRCSCCTIIKNSCWVGPSNDWMLLMKAFSPNSFDWNRFWFTERQPAINSESYAPSKWSHCRQNKIEIFEQPSLPSSSPLRQIPRHYRLPFNHIVGYVFTSTLSSSIKYFNIHKYLPWQFWMTSHKWWAKRIIFLRKSMSVLISRIAASG